jgi:hypothetical protein
LSPPEKYPTFDIKTLIGVEPSSGMREAWQKGTDKLPKQTIERKKVESVDGTFDDFSKAGLSKEEADAVIIAQAFHWCPDYEGALVRPPNHIKMAADDIARDCNLSQARSTTHSDLEPRKQGEGSPQESHVFLRAI